VDPPCPQVNRSYHTRDFKFLTVIGKGGFGKVKNALLV